MPGSGPWQLYPASAGGINTSPFTMFTVDQRPPLATAIVYSPSADAEFVCFEPVSHSVDAHNRSDPESAPPQVLAPGDLLVISMTISPDT